MFSAVASGIFAVRNADKTKHGEVGRSAVTLGQTAGLVQEIAKYDGLAANAARSTLSVFSDLAKQNKMFDYAGKVTKFAVNNVNPLICASGVIKTAMSDDKVGTGITEQLHCQLCLPEKNLLNKTMIRLLIQRPVKIC